MPAPADGGAMTRGTEGADYETVSVEIDDEVATLWLERPDSRNALSSELSRDVVAALDDLEAANEARALVIRGRGGAFSAGGDVDAMLERLAGDVPLEAAVRTIQQEISRTIRRVHEFYLPTVAAVDGPAFGAGANLAIAADCAVASDDARIGFGFRQVGLAVDSGTSYLLPRIVGENVAKELVFTGELLDAERAADLGLFNHVYPAGAFDERARAFVGSLADGPTVALSTSKRLLGDGLDKSLRAAQDDEAAAQAAVFETRDHREGVEAFMESREPAFEGR